MSQENPEVGDVFMNEDGTNAVLLFINDDGKLSNLILHHAIDEPSFREGAYQGYNIPELLEHKRFVCNISILSKITGEFYDSGKS